MSAVGGRAAEIIREAGDGLGGHRGAAVTVGRQLGGDDLVLLAGRGGQELGQGGRKGAFRAGWRCGWAPPSSPQVSGVPVSTT